MIKTYFEQQIKEKFGLLPTFQQEKALNWLTEYLFSKKTGQIFLLKGYAGTGKTSLIAALVKVLSESKQPLVLLAPTGRAAKVFSGYANHAAYTIHRTIYREKSYQGITGEFVLNFNKHPHTVFIVDESSMISNQGLSGTQFGTGRLLDDLISYVFQQESSKLILLGDTAQLPPVGETDSPALSAQALRRYGLDVQEIELTQVVRQQQESGILHNATLIRQWIQQQASGMPKIQLTGFADICRLPGNELVETLSNSYSRQGIDETMVICRSNKLALRYNNGIRNMILDHDEVLNVNDRVIIAKNNYFWTEKIKQIDFLANGDMAVIKRVRNHRELYGFEFVDIIFHLPDYEDLEMEATAMIGTLQNENPTLTKEEQERLFTAVMEDYQDIPQKPQRMAALRQDCFFNALQIKYAYAMTCHKSQGGQWAHVFLDQGYMPEENYTPEYFHWLYTAFTRAKEKLYLVNWPKEQQA